MLYRCACAQAAGITSSELAELKVSAARWMLQASRVGRTNMNNFLLGLAVAAFFARVQLKPKQKSKSVTPYADIFHSCRTGLNPHPETGHVPYVYGQRILDVGKHRLDVVQQEGTG